MYQKETTQYLEIAKESAVFTPDDIAIIEEVLSAYALYPEKDYFLLEEKEKDIPIGFILFGKNTLTSFSWEIYWISVKKDFQGQGVGKKLLRRLEDFILKREPCVILRVETSSTPPYQHARILYNKLGFEECGRIANFYGENDDWIVYYKQIGVPESENMIFNIHEFKESSCAQKTSV